MNVGSLFAGIGGFDLAARWVGWRTKWYSEIDPYAVRVMERWFPDAYNVGDITKWMPVANAFTGEPRERGRQRRRNATSQGDTVDLICGGFPCQPVSVAGKQLAQDDPRWLWPHFARVVRILRPNYVVIENVPGLLSIRQQFNVPIDRCLCGWVGGRRGMSLSDAAAEGVCGTDGHGDECQGPTAARGNGEPLRGNREAHAESVGTLGGGPLLDSDGQEGSTDTSATGASPTHQTRTSRNPTAIPGHDRLAIPTSERDSIVDGQGSGTGGGNEPENQGIESEGTTAQSYDGIMVCPACGREVGDDPEGLFERSGMGDVLGDLSALGYDAEWESIPASAVGAPHRRDRVWIVAYAQPKLRDQSGRRSRQSGTRPSVSGDDGPQESVADTQERGQSMRGCPPREAGQSLLSDEDVADTAGTRLYRTEHEKCWQGATSFSRRPADSGWWAVEPDVGRVAHGVPSRVDRLRCLGNAIVPQVAEWIFRQINEHEVQGSS